MIVERFVNGRARSNAYVYAPAPDGPCLIVDPGVGATASIVRSVRAARLTPLAVLLTHGHPDHMWTARQVSGLYEIPVHLHAADWRWFDDPATGAYLPLARLAGKMVGRVARLRPRRLHQLEGHQVLRFEGIEVRALHTPGHTAGSMCLCVGASAPGGTGGAEVCFTGDTVFAGRQGHTVYPGGERRALRRSIRVELLPLPDGLRLYPGHGRETTMADERATLEAFAGG